MQVCPICILEVRGWHCLIFFNSCALFWSLLLSLHFVINKPQRSPYLWLVVAGVTEAHYGAQVLHGCQASEARFLWLTQKHLSPWAISQPFVFALKWSFSSQLKHTVNLSIQSLSIVLLKWMACHFKGAKEYYYCFDGIIFTIQEPST